MFAMFGIFLRGISWPNHMKYIEIRPKTWLEWTGFLRVFHISEARITKTGHVGTS